MVSDPSRWQSSAPIRYPDPDIVVLDKRFRHLVVPMAAIERIATGFRFTEGPVYYGDGRYLLFSDIPNDALVRWDELTGHLGGPAPQCRPSRRQHARPPGPAGHLRARQPHADPHRA